jgi:hypothetical protein
MKNEDRHDDTDESVDDMENGGGRGGSGNATPKKEIASNRLFVAIAIVIAVIGIALIIIL